MRRLTNLPGGNAVSAASYKRLATQRRSSSPANGAAANLRRRLLTAGIGIPVVLLAIFGGVPGVVGIALAAALVAGYEIAALGRQHGFSRAASTAVPLLLVAATAVFAFFAPVGAEVRGSVIGVSATLAGLAVLVAVVASPRVSPLARIGLLAAIYFGVMLAHAPALARLENGREWVLIAVLGTFAADTGAYAVGSLFGRHGLAPRISPAKSIEGLAGGVLASAGAVTALVAIVDPGIAVWSGALLGAAMGVAGAAGDILESWLKRRAGVKESGSLIPGHGGILDRIDSLAPNFAVVYLAAIWASV